MPFKARSKAMKIKIYTYRQLLTEKRESVSYPWYRSLNTPRFNDK